MVLQYRMMCTPAQLGKNLMPTGKFLSLKHFFDIVFNRYFVGWRGMQGIVWFPNPLASFSSQIWARAVSYSVQTLNFQSLPILPLTPAIERGCVSQRKLSTICFNYNCSDLVACPTIATRWTQPQSPLRQTPTQVQAFSCRRMGALWHLEIQRLG